MAKIPAAELGSLVIRSLLDKTGLPAQTIDEVVMGHVLTAGAGQNTARQAAIKAGVPVTTPAMTINKVCGSGLKATHLAAQSILLGDADVVVAGGMESMSLAPYVVPGLRTGLRMGHGQVVDTMIVDGLWDAFNQYHMGITAENLAKRHGITREQQDEYAVLSQTRAAAAIAAGRFMSAERAAKLGLPVLAKVVSYASAGVDPAYMGEGPISATQRCLQKTGWTLASVDLIEANEAFAAQSLTVAKKLELDIEKVNVNGGAIALGHPIGASGCRVLVTLIHEMARRDAKRGLATLCIGGGQGVALAIERV